MSMSEAEVIKCLRGLIDERHGGDQASWARENDLSAQYVNDVLRGRRSPGPRMLDALNLRRVVLYEILGPKDVQKLRRSA